MTLASIMRWRALRPLWARLHRISLIGLNYWSSELPQTGELDALDWIARRLGGQAERIVFDVGANVGDYSQAVLDRFGAPVTVHAFEPSLATHARLAGRFAGDTRVRAHRLALSSSDGTALLRTSEPGSSIASLEPLDRPVRAFVDGLTEEVETTTLDRFCEQHGIDRIDLLKIDIEGHEAAAMAGASRMLADHRVRFVQFEFGENDLSSRHFLADFVRLLDGYDLYQVVPGGPVPWTYEGGRSEIFATMNYLAERRARGSA